MGKGRIVQEAGVISREEAAQLRSLLARLRNQSYSVLHAPTQEFPSNDQIPAVYLARTPGDGIAAYTLLGTGTGEIPVLNSAVCEIWRLPDDGQLVQVGNFKKRVWSFYNFDIPGDTWILVKHEGYGKWMAEWFDQADDLDTGTGTGTGTTSECPTWDTYERKYECEWATTGTCTSVGTGEGQGLLNEYSRRTEFWTDENGCLQTRTHDWVFERTIACCDPSCACEPGTGEEVGVTCCADPVPALITGTLTNVTGNCNCVGTPYNLRYTGDGKWHPVTVPNGCDLAGCAYLECVGGDWSFSTDSCFATPATLVSADCDPFEIIFDVTSAEVDGQLCTGSFRITFTETP